MDGFEVPLGGFLEGGHRQTGQRVLEAQHGAFAVVLLIACMLLVSVFLLCGGRCGHVNAHTG